MYLLKKQALIITAYHNEDMLEKNLRSFSKYFKCYVHIDAKSSLNNSNFLSKLNGIDDVYAISKYKINWGSYLHMMAVVDLLKEAYKDSDIIRFHIISGEDFPIKSFEEFYNFFEKDNLDKNFIELTDIRNMPIMKLRYEKFHFLHLLNRKSTNRGLILFDKIVRQFQYHIPFKRLIKFDYKGLMWCSITKEAVKVIFEYLTPKMIKSLKYCEIAEEFFIQNSLMESDLFRTVVPRSLRYTNWNGCLTGPQVLTIDKLEEINNSNDFFARKIKLDENDKCVNDLYIALKQKWDKQ